MDFIMLVLALLMVLAILVWITLRPERCPSCKARAIRLWEAARAYPMPVPSYYRCERCGLRLRRLLNGPWEDASAVKYDSAYKDAPPLPLSPTASYRRRD